MAKKIKVAIGDTFGRLTVIDMPSLSSARLTRQAWTFSCECGNIIKTLGKYVYSGQRKSCGCLISNRDGHPFDKATWREERIKSGKCPDCVDSLLPGQRRCTACLAKVVAQNSLRKANRIRDKKCKECANEAVFDRKHCRSCLDRICARAHKLSVEEVVRLRSLPCEACGVKNTVIVIDHDHQTGQVRGGLCNGCNAALGQVKENPETLEALADYIRRHAVNREVFLSAQHQNRESECGAGQPETTTT